MFRLTFLESLNIAHAVCNIKGVALLVTSNTTIPIYDHVKRLKSTYGDKCLVVLATNNQRTVMINSGRPYALSGDYFIDPKHRGEIVVRLEDFVEYRKFF